MDHLVFAKKLVSELISRTPQLHFDLQNAYDQYVFLLYASLIEIAHSINTLVEQDATVATKTITRGMLEAWVDFINLIDDPEYISYLSLRNLEEWLKTYREAQNGNEVFAQILESPDFQQRLEHESAEAERLRADGVRLLNVRQRFEKADLLDIYGGVYAWLCSESHNSYRALVRRHIVTSEKSMSLNVLKETSIEDHLQVLDTLGEILLKSATVVHEKYGETADAVADLEIEFRQVRKSIIQEDIEKGDQSKTLSPPPI